MPRLRPEAALPLLPIQENSKPRRFQDLPPSPKPNDSLVFLLSEEPPHTPGAQTRNLEAVVDIPSVTAWIRRPDPWWSVPASLPVGQAQRGHQQNNAQ